jgi:hypothetical protein
MILPRSPQLCQKAPFSFIFNRGKQRRVGSRPRWVWSFCIRLMLSFPNTCLITTMVSVTLFLRFAHIRCRIHREITSGQIQDSK